jgi:hypothetical protein
MPPKKTVYKGAPSDDSILLMPSENPKWQFEVYSGPNLVFAGYMGRLRPEEPASNAS